MRAVAFLSSLSAVSVMLAAAAHAAPVAGAGYTVTTFALGLAGTSGADSVEVFGGNVYIGYSNGTPKDGSGGTSTIAEYNAGGALLNSATVAGHNDGLRYDPTSGKLWSMQNEDGNPNVMLLTPGSLAKSSVLVFSAIPHGGGYDDALFTKGGAFLTASNPGKSPNTDPALVSAVLSSGMVNVAGVLNGNASATPLNAGAPTTLNLQDPDSLSLTQDGKLVLDSQGDGVLVFLTNPGTPAQTAASLLLQAGVLVDDTVFAAGTEKTLLVADKTTNIVYAITGAFGFNIGYSAAQDAAGEGFVGALNADGSYSQMVTGLGNPGGEAFLVPEPASVTMLGIGLLGLLGLRRRRAG